MSEAPTMQSRFGWIVPFALAFAIGWAAGELIVKPMPASAAAEESRRA